jgi:hypothetical protein
MAPTRFTSGALITRNNFDALDGGFPRPRCCGKALGRVLVLAERAMSSARNTIETILRSTKLCSLFGVLSSLTQRATNERRVAEKEQQ